MQVRSVAAATPDTLQPEQASVGLSTGVVFQLLGQSLAMETVRETAADLAKRRTTVMILGPTGSGKEMVARYIHSHSARADGPFVPVDCTTLAESLFESEMFGHTRGSFTGATHDTLGIIRSAEGGTLFLDELGELSLPMQAKLLRVLQERRVTPLGGTKSYPVDIRVLCATHCDLPKMVRDRTFREDLYYRLNVVVVQVPSLSARQEDVPELARHFLQIQADVYDEPVKQFTADAFDALSAYAWPGNVRELANIVEHAHVLSRGTEIEVADLPARLTTATIAPRGVDRALHLPTLERDAIQEALRRCRNNKAAASRLLGLNVQRLKRRIQVLGL